MDWKYQSIEMWVKVGKQEIKRSSSDFSKSSDRPSTRVVICSSFLVLSGHFWTLEKLFAMSTPLKDGKRKRQSNIGTTPVSIYGDRNLIPRIEKVSKRADDFFSLSSLIESIK